MVTACFQEKMKRDGCWHAQKVRVLGQTLGARKKSMALPVDLLSQELSVLFGHTITKYITHIEWLHSCAPDITNQLIINCCAYFSRVQLWLRPCI